MLINRRFHSQVVIKMVEAFRWSELVGVFSWGVVTSKMFGTSVLSSLFFFPSGDFAFKAFALSASSFLLGVMHKQGCLGGMLYWITASSFLLGVMHKQGCLGGMLYWIRFLELQFRPRRLPPSFPPSLPFFFFFFFFFFLADSFLVVFVLIFSRFLLGANLAWAAVGMVGAGRCSCFRRFAG